MKKRKRFLDITVASISLLLALPVMIIVALAIKIDSPGPILYYYRGSQRRLPVYRIGKNGKPFRYFKFRTMFHDPANPQREELTRVGYFIRCWHLDELPELIIVLSGKMSLVGPRPFTKKMAQKHPPIYQKTLVVAPGITGLAQISGARLFSPEQTVETNLQYIKTWRLRNDLVILLKTPAAIVEQYNKFPH